MWRAALAAAALCACARAGGDSCGSARLTAALTGGQRGARYSVQSAVLLDEAAPAAALAGGELGYLISATLTVQLAALQPAPHCDLLLRFTLEDAELRLRGAARGTPWAARPSLWDAPAQRRSEFAARLRDGALVAAYLQPADPPAARDYKRSLLALFQFQTEEGERNETDVSGDCAALYETLDDRRLRKTKSACRWAGGGEAEGAGVESHRITAYELAPAAGGEAVREVFAEELHSWGAPAAGAGAGLRVRSWHRLEREPPAAGGAAPARDVAAALAGLPPDLRPHPLALDPLADDDEEAAEEAAEAEAALEAWAALEQEEAGAGGGAAAALALARAVPAARRASPARLRALLARDDRASLAAPLRLLGLAGSPAAHAAAAQLLQLHADPPEPLADLYLAAFALAPHPHETVVREVTRLGAESRSARVAEAALLAAAAAAHRAGDEELARHVRDALTRALARCKDEPCRAARLRALGNLRRADTAELLLEHAERGGRDAALAALAALDAAPLQALWGRERRLLRVALALGPRAAGSAPPALEVRAAALELGVRRAAAAGSPLALAPAARALHAHGPRELRRLFWRRVASLAEAEGPDVAPGSSMRLVETYLPAALRTWAARAARLAGSSAALRRGTGWAAAGWRARLDSLQVAARGVLRRGAVRLELLDPHGAERDALAVELWTRGLAALAPAAPAGAAADDDGDADEELAGGLELSVVGVRLRPIELFASQAELVGHVWAGTGSSPTPVLRAAVPLPLPGAGSALAVPLAAGAVLRARSLAAATLALDAQAQVSLWSRTARAQLELRGALAGESRAALRLPWGRVRAESHAFAAPRMRISADLDFYDEVALCVRVHIDDHEHGRDVSLQSRQGAREWRVARSRQWRRPVPGRTLALGSENDRACRALG